MKKFALIKDGKMIYKYEANEQQVFGESESHTQVEIPEAIALEHAQWDGEKIIEVIPFESVEQKRKKAYDSEGCSKAEMLDALLSKEFDNNPAAWNQIKSKRNEIKLRHPKDK